MFDRLMARQRVIPADRALPGRDTPIVDPTSLEHRVLGGRLDPVPDGSETAEFALGCFWGAEKLFWELPGVTSTAVGYQGGSTPHPTYEETCSGLTGHTETVRVAFDPARISYTELLKLFYENHDPTQGMRQGNDLGTQYRSAVFPHGAAQEATVATVQAAYDAKLREAGFGQVTTEVARPGPFYFAEAYHQQYLDRVPNGYCPHHATGVRIDLDQLGLDLPTDADGTPRTFGGLSL